MESKIIYILNLKQMLNSQKYTIDQISAMYTKEQIMKTVNEAVCWDKSDMAKKSDTKAEMVEFLMYNIDSVNIASEENYDIIEFINESNNLK